LDIVRSLRIEKETADADELAFPVHEKGEDTLALIPGLIDDGEAGASEVWPSERLVIGRS
jgi:hypothetical protein